MANVELHQAFSWDCAACGASNFAHAVTVPREEAAEIIEAQGIEVAPGTGLTLVCAPDTVTCGVCATIFEAVEEGDDDDD